MDTYHAAYWSDLSSSDEDDELRLRLPCVAYSAFLSLSPKYLMRGCTVQEPSAIMMYYSQQKHGHQIGLV